MITFVGDVHKFWEAFYYQLEEKIPQEDEVIQVGDIGIWPDVWDDIALPRKVYFIEGNHEYYPYITGITEVTEIRPNLFYCPRGTVMELDGRRIAFLGGAESIDKYSRGYRIDWFPEEGISEADYRKFDDMGPVDILVTHTPPYDIVMETTIFDDSPAWVNMSARVVTEVWHKLGKPILVSGHMHTNYKKGNIYVLDELSWTRL